eukprot:scaffold6795_cov110-Cylindrotheca_fusiformis.AAC.7
MDTIYQSSFLVWMLENDRRIVSDASSPPSFAAWSLSLIVLVFITFQMCLRRVFLNCRPLVEITSVK